MKINPINKKDGNQNKRQYYDYFSTKISRETIKDLSKNEKDEKYLFLLKNGILRRFEEKGGLLYVEIPQIPHKIIVYRKLNLRLKDKEKIYLNKKDLPQIPLLEKENNEISIKCLGLESNLITNIDNLFSLNNLLFLNLYDNKISEIENLEVVPLLKVLMLGKNNISKIKNLQCLINLEVLDLHYNKIKTIENLESLNKLKIINLANNQITSFSVLKENKNLENINLSKNLIESVPNLSFSFCQLKTIKLDKNMISDVNYLLEFKKLKRLEELYIENNPIVDIKEACKKINSLPLKFKSEFQSLFFKNNINSSNDIKEINISLINNKIINITNKNQGANKKISLNRNYDNYKKNNIKNRYQSSNKNKVMDNINIKNKNNNMKIINLSDHLIINPLKEKKIKF